MRARRRPSRGSDGSLVRGNAKPDRPRAAGSGPGWRPSRARVGAVLALAAAAFCVWFLVSLFQPFAGEGSGRVIVVIPKGASSGKIGSILARDGVVPSGFFFELRALLEGKRGSLRSGRFQLKRNMSYAAAIDALTKPPPPAIVLRATIPEGYTRLHTGLPPTPIANPGMASIEAAAHPASVPYLYYVVAPDGCGEHVFSRTYADFQKHVAAYRAALVRNGGRPPVCKRK